MVWCSHLAGLVSARVKQQSLQLPGSELGSICQSRAVHLTIVSDVLLSPPSLAYPPIYPSVRGSTLNVHGERLVNRPAVKMTTKVAGDTPV